MKTAIVWFRNDLRLEDHAVLKTALEKAQQVIPFYCFDDHYWQNTYLDFPKVGPFRSKFLQEAVQDLRDQCRDLGADLVVRRGSPAEHLKSLAHRFGAEAIFTAREATREEQEREDQVTAQGLNLIRLDNYSLYHPEDVPFDLEYKLPKVFTPFRKKLEKASSIRPPLPRPSAIPVPHGLKAGTIPSLEELGVDDPDQDDRRVLDFRGGSTAGWARLDYYLWDTHLLSKYKETRNGLLGGDYSSKFSPWLAAGCLSPRSIYAEVQRYEAEVTKNSSTYWLIFELVWRDFFRYQALSQGDRFFRMKKSWTPRTHRDFEKWRLGETGQDFVDANMRELLHTGFMSNRGRQNVASYLVKDLGQPWIAGALWFESRLIDSEVCSNYGNWTYQTGIGNDPRPDRYFKVSGQAERYDPDGAYRKTWLQ